jgi:DNA N-6-adenine-methyltransferase (Dam)/Protein of unknown function (DUF3102)
LLDIQQSALFDYGSLDSDTRAFVQKKAQSIHARLKRTAEDVIAIGQDLIEVKARLQHGQFEKWLDCEFGMSLQAARNFIHVARRFGNKSTNFVDFPVSVLYELAAPSTPDTIIKQVETGQIEPTLPAIREAKQQLRREEVSSEQWRKDNLALGLDEFCDPLTVAEEPTDAPLCFPENFGKVTFPELPQRTYPDYVHPLERGLYDAFSEVVAREQEQVMAVSSPSRGVPAALQSSESNEWYTPREYVDAVRELLGTIDVDPASNALANEIVRATTLYDFQTNGLEYEWTGRVFLNPPYGFDSGRSNQEIWTQRLLQQFNAGITTEAVLLVNANTEAKWFQPLYDYLICLTNHRIRFYNASGDSSQPTQGNALIYFGSQRARFLALFSRFGTVIERARADE